MKKTTFVAGLMMAGAIWGAHGQTVYPVAQYGAAVVNARTAAGALKKAPAGTGRVFEDAGAQAKFEQYFEEFKRMEGYSEDTAREAAEAKTRVWGRGLQEPTTK